MHVMISFVFKVREDFGTFCQDSHCLAKCAVLSHAMQYDLAYRDACRNRFFFSMTKMTVSVKWSLGSTSDL